jgi:hypothetical protein
MLASTNPIQALAYNVPPPCPNSSDKTPLLLGSISPPTNVQVSSIVVAKLDHLLHTIITQSTIVDRIVVILANIEIPKVMSSIFHY